MRKEWGEHCEVGDRHRLDDILLHCSELRQGYAVDTGGGLEAIEFVVSSCLARFDKADGDLLGANMDELGQFRVRGVRRLCVWVRPAGRKLVWEKTSEFRLPS